MHKAPVDISSPFDTPAQARLRRVVLGAAQTAGIRLERLEDTRSFVPGRSAYTTDLQHKVAATPGMITIRRAMYLYWLAYAGSIAGDVVEIGSWQGRSTIALAQACEDGDNGVVHAIDTFRGNPGNESAYVVGRPDLSDLEERFRRNIAAAALSHRVVVHPTSSAEAITEVAAADRPVRMIYIDGEHTYAAVREELELYTPRLAPGGLLTFDDYSRRYEGVARAIHEWLDVHGPEYVTPVQDRNFLVLRKR